MSSLWLMIFSIVSGLIKFANDIMNKIKEQDLKNQGKTELASEINEKEAELARKQAEILAQNQTTPETIDKLNDGKF